MKFSLIFTTYNEEKSIKELLESIFRQTRVPDEIVILDSLSRDRTVEIIKSFKSKKIKLIEKKADIGTARNIAIGFAKHDIILVTDGGCVLDKNWCEEMLKPFKNPEIKVVGGAYKPLSKNFFERCQGIIVCKPVEKIKSKSFLPSSRSFGFKKEVWEAVGGYPKHEVGGEDTLFDLRIKQKGYKIEYNKNAVVYWRMRSPLKNFIKQFYLYAVGSTKIGNLEIMKKEKIIMLFAPVYLTLILFSLIIKFELFLLLVSPIMIYLIYNGLNVMIKTKDLRGFYWGIILVFLKRSAYIFGVWREWVIPYRKGYKNENY